MAHHHGVSGMAYELGLAGIIYICCLPLVWLIVWTLGDPKLRLRRIAFLVCLVGEIIAWRVWG